MKAQTRLFQQVIDDFCYLWEKDSNYEFYIPRDEILITVDDPSLQIYDRFGERIIEQIAINYDEDTSKERAVAIVRNDPEWPVHETTEGVEFYIYKAVRCLK